MKYDVFLSSKSEDYSISEKVYDFLVSNGLKVFLASRELDRLGEAEYANAIDKVLDTTTHMVVVASSIDNIKSKWVQYEWSTFSNDLKSQFRDGNLITVLADSIVIKDLPASLRHQQSFTISDYKYHLLSYLNPNREHNNDSLYSETINTKQSKIQTISTIDSLKRIIKNCSKNKGCILTFSLLFLLLIVSSFFLLKNPFNKNNSNKTNSIDSTSVNTDSVSHIYSSFSNDSIKTFSINGIPIEMRYVEGGKFIMGGEYDSHKVEISSFLIGKTEVTQQLWNTIMYKSDNYYLGPKKPIDNVTYEECLSFIHELNACTGQEFRLPTEAEWEYAARGGKKSKDYKFSGSDNIDEVAWYSINSRTDNNNCCSCSTHEVALKKPNELGLYDMSGNVCEWCSDFIDWDIEYYKSLPSKNPQGPKTGLGHIKRGGACNMIADCQRPNNRLHAVAQHGSQKPIGLRLAMSISK